ncbi:MAG TPA: cyclic pyranopterin monophosphate synthase MoaC [Thermodesulfobacteriota bacterium]|nr:cyclic pyranopterin monophosphate synthase MoaC [Thermodesulfobacteriota bacterium]
MTTPTKGERLTHFDESGAARMVDVGAKPVTRREAVARGAVRMQEATFRRIVDRTVEKGDVLGVARVAGIMAAKRTGELIPMCHPLPLSSVALDFRLVPPSAAGGEGVVEIEARAAVEARTGVEMEALTAVAVAALTIYDMCKAVDRGMVIEAIRLVRKSGGESGTYVRPGEP